jgi:hypothetical protein
VQIKANDVEFSSKSAFSLADGLAATVCSIHAIVFDRLLFSVVRFAMFRVNLHFHGKRKNDQRDKRAYRENRTGAGKELRNRRA